jgi:glycosyltransferase involved in cell wall biosynthesis
MTTNIDGPGVLDVPLDRPVDMDGVQVWYYPVERPRWYCFSRPLGRALRERVGDYDVVHIHSIFLWPTTVAAYWSRRRKVPYVVHPAGALDTIFESKEYQSRWAGLLGNGKKWLYMRTLGRLDLDRASGMQYTSEVDMETSRRLDLGAPGYVLPLGVDPPSPPADAAAATLREEHPRLAGKRIVLFLARLAPNKGFNILLEALAQLAAHRSDFALVVAGSGTPAYEREVAGLVLRHGLQDRTVMLGFVNGDDKWRVLSEADIFVLPSHHENFPVAVVEALASGLPVIVSDRVMLHREIKEAGAGLVTGLGPAEVAAATEALLEDDDLRTRMAAAAEVLVRERYDWEVVATKTTEVYERVVAGAAKEHTDAVVSSTK